MSNEQNQSNKEYPFPILDTTIGLSVSGAGVTHKQLAIKDITVAASTLRSDYVFLDDTDGSEMLRITPTAFIFKGESITDAGRAYDGFTRMLEAKGYLRPKMDKNVVSFLSEQESLVRQAPVRAEEMIDSRDVVDAPGTVRIHRKKGDWMLALSTQKVIPNTTAAVKQFLNEGNPVPYTEQQLATMTVSKDRRKHNTGYAVSLNITGDGPNEVAFLSGPLAD